MQSIQQQLAKLTRQLAKVMLADQYVFRQEIGRIRHAAEHGATREDLTVRCQKLGRRIERSAAICRERGTCQIHLTFDKNLPIIAKKEQLLDAISKNQVLIVAGETGSGKTTQLPKLCLAAGLGARGCIGVTQPRRIAATSVCSRIAEELNEPVGETAAYKIRFKDTTGPKTRIKIMTDGILLAEAHKDRYLDHYDTIIVDEAHERSLNIDFILGLLQKILIKRKDLKLIITSATIDTEKFSRAFNQAPVIEVSGRMFPVETRYFKDVDEGDEEISHLERAVKAVDQLRQTRAQGDILIFMPTEQDIRDTCEILEGRRYPATRIIPLFARLSAAEQQKVFHTGNGRRIIVATNVAETSITIPGIQYVIDTGLARILQYTPRTRTTTLPVLPIAQSNADQRQGRCGRVANGICIRLYSEEDYANRPRYALPEILRANLAEVILRMIALNLGDVETYPFIDPPETRSIQDGYNLLTELGAIKANPASGRSQGKFNLTVKGRLMAQLPLDPRLSCMLLEARQRNCLDDIAILAAALSIQDPRERPMEKQADADQAQARFMDPGSDFITLLRIWHAYSDIFTKRKNWAQVKKFCHSHFLSFRRMREWQDIYHQIISVLAEHDIQSPNTSKTPDEKIDPQNSWYAAVHQSILSGFLSNIAVKKEKQLFTASHNRQTMIFPGSGLFKNPGQWIVAAEMVETSRLFARCAAVIQPGWLEPLAVGQCKYSYSDPHWERRRGEVAVTEQVTLYGLIIDRRTRPYGPVDPAEASEIFIRHALIQGDVRRPLPFMAHNQALIADIADMEDRLRRRDLLVEEQAMFRFYQERLGLIFDMRTLENLIRKTGGDNFLRMNRDDLLRYRIDNDMLAPFPDHLHIDRQRIDCDYRFTPGKEDDGITARIPAAVAGGISAENFQWLVPGLLKEKIIALIKGLPKGFRKQLVPITDTVAIIAAEMPVKTNMNLINALSRFIQQRFDLAIPATAWDESVLPNHLRMRLAITDSDGNIIRSGRDLDILKQIADKGNEAEGFDAARKAYERGPISQWDFGDLAQTVTLESQKGQRWTAYPALEQRPDGITLTAFMDLQEAAKTHLNGVRALLALQFTEDIKFLRKNLKLPASCDQAARYFGGRQKLEEQLVQRVIHDLMAVHIRDAVGFARYTEQLKKKGITAQGLTTRHYVMEVLDGYHGVRMLLMSLEKAHPNGGPVAVFISDLRTTLQHLVPEHFITLYDDKHLKDLVRYLKALVVRAERGVVNPEKDRAKAVLLEPFTAKLEELIQSFSPRTSTEKRTAVEELFWMIEEFKISLFAQEIKTAFPISEKKLRQKIKTIEGML